MIWKPNVTVAAVIEQKGKFLLVEEQPEIGLETVFNQPAGHLEPGESIPEGAIRETMEETGYTFVPYWLQGVYNWHSSVNDTTYLRFAFSGEVKDFDPDLGFLMNRTRERMQVVGLEQALDEMFDRVPSNEMRSFVMTLKQSIQYGSSIYEVLTNLSSEIRAVQMLSIEEKIGKLAAKMSVPLILFIMFPIVILIAAPGVMRMIN